MCVCVFQFLQTQTEFSKQAVVSHSEYAWQITRSLNPVWPKSRQAWAGELKYQLQSAALHSVHLTVWLYFLSQQFWKGWHLYPGMGECCGTICL